MGMKALKTIQSRDSKSMSKDSEGREKSSAGSRRGTGVRILSVLSCGPNMNVEEHRKKYEKCVEL
jgi:hypothetical protein